MEPQTWRAAFLENLRPRWFKIKFWRIFENLGRIEVDILTCDARDFKSS